VLGYTVSNPSLSRALWAAIPYVLLVAATFLHTTILDFEGDRASGKKSTSVLIGVRLSAYLSTFLHAAAFAAAFVRVAPAAMIITGVTLPLSIYAIARGSKRTSSFIIQANTFVVTVAAATAWPLYLAVAAPLVLLSRCYHARRFGITYPGKTS
jgi:1,4-dihydroxy-2-naphthoate octaprenyltransferase